MTDWAMTDAEFEKEKTRVGAAIDRWFDPMGLKTWQQIGISYWREPLTDDSGNSLTATADCHVEWQYLCAHVRFSLPRTADLDDDQLDYLVRHEFLHALVHEMREEDDDIKHEERVVTQLAMVLGWVREQGKADAVTAVASA